MKELKDRVSATLAQIRERASWRHEPAMTRISVAVWRMRSGRGRLLSVPQDELAVLDDQIDGPRAGDSPGLRIECRLAIDHARDILDLSQAVADRRAIRPILVDHSGQEDDRVISDSVEVVRLLVVFGAELVD